MKIKVKDADRFNALMIEKGFNKTDFAKEVQLSLQMMIQIANGDRSPSPKAAKRIVVVLECEWGEVFEIVKSPQREVPEAAAK